MSIGNPVVICTTPQGRQFKSLAATSTKGDDPNAFAESLLQELIEQTPDILPVREFLPSTSALFSLAREVPVDIGGSEGAIDNLLVTNDGFIVIVETKLHRNSESIRQVVTQTLQYGMAVGQLSILELESRIRRGVTPALKRDESISECVGRLANDKHEALADDFEETLEKHLREGEFLLLVVSDGIRIGVERVTSWLNRQGNSSPFKFGLIELKFHSINNQLLVIPRTVLKTREVSRHTVVVDIRPIADVSVSAKVTDDFRNTSGGKVQESRTVKVASAPMTKSTFLEHLAPEERQLASQLIEQLEISGFDQQGTPSTLKIGFTTEDEEFHSLLSLNKSGAWVWPLKKDRDLLGSDRLLKFRMGSNQFGRFYREDQLEQEESSGCAVKYRQLAGNAADFAAFLDSYRTQLIELADSAD